MHPVRVTGPAAKPISLSQVKSHLSIDTGDFDARLELCIDAAIAHLDGWSGCLGRCLINQEWRLHLDAWPCDRNLRLPFPNCRNIVVTYRDVANAEQTLSPDNYSDPIEISSGTAVLAWRDKILPALCCRPASVTIAFQSGYGSAGSDVPAAIRQAMLLMIGDMFRFTETAAMGTATAVPMSATVDALLAPHRRVSS